MIKITNEIIRTAKYVDLPNFLTKNGEQLKKNGRYSYTLTNHDSLVIRLSDKGFWIFFWNSQNTRGDAIKFIMDFYTVDFKQAISMLIEHGIYYNRTSNNSNYDSATPKFKSINLELTNDMKRVYAYLTKSRQIGVKLVQSLISEKMLFQDDKGNAVFPFYNEDRNIVGAELHGTLTSVRFKAILSGSQYGYSYSISQGTPKALFCFESAIDLLSYITLRKELQNSLLISLAGLKDEIIYQTLKRYKSLQEINVCTDNDQAGQDFAKKIKKNIECRIIIPPIGKDWNDCLKFKAANPMH